MEAHRRSAARGRARGYGASMQLEIATSGERPAELPSGQRELIRFWYEPPDRLREEGRTLGPHGHERVVVKDGARWWTYSPDVESQGEWLGRPALRVRGQPRVGHEIV